MRFDLVSFVIGLVVGIALSVVVYLRRETLHRLWEAVVARLRRLREQLAANIESRYRTALRAHCDQLNLTQTYADFETLYLDRAFDPPPARPTLTPPDPAAQAPIGLSAALRAAHRLVVQGESGSGRTTLLIKLARVYSDKQAQAEFGVAGERTPLLLHLAEIDWATVTEDDPLTPLINAAAAHVSRLIASNVSTFLKSHVQSNHAVLLIDGFDEIAPALHPNVIQWLSAMLTKFPDNRVVITAGPYGYGALNNLGFAALHLTPWTAKEIDQLAQRWVKVINGGKKDIELLSKGLRQIAGITPVPIDLMLAAIDWRTNTTLPTKTGEAYGHWIDRAIRPPDAKELSTPDKYTAVLGKIAWSTYQNNRIELTYEEIEQAVISAVSTPVPSAAPTDDEAPATQSAQPARSALAIELARDIVERTGLLVPFGLSGWAFIHSRIAAYLAAWHVVHSGEALELNWAKPEWAEVFEFYAGLADPGEIVNLMLGTTDDLSRSHLWRAAQWTGRAAPDAAWRSRGMGELARTFLQPDQYRRLRDRALNGLLATRDKGLGYLLKRGVTHSDPIVRALALEGLGKIGREAEVPLLTAALGDPAAEVHSAALRAIGVIAVAGSSAAVEQLIKIMLEQNEDDRKLAAELLAQCGLEGQQILREGIGEEDIQVRRAAAYGLAAIGQDWARDLLKKLEHDDKQWFVRSAATDALSILQRTQRKPTEEPPPDLTPVTIDRLGWLTEWAALQGIGIGVGRQAVNALMRALDEGQPPARVAAIHTLRDIGDLSHHDKLRELLLDPDRSVRDAAFAALETIGQRLGQAIPR